MANNNSKKKVDNQKKTTNAAVEEQTSTKVVEQENTVVEVAEPVKEKKVKEKKEKEKVTKKANREPKKSRVKETFGELKKVTWPSFGKTMKQTGMVLSVVLVFGLLVLGIDSLISLILKLINKI